ncbi:unnamed protein product [Owenia fusiformis]|uniref:DNA 3'-5' helicase n=1 Tax=Owenia fusiformis TaxID=6347 RepID=A0A8J1UTM1_OWEFU|nr:unnamed protein product [Owenia fusiformis]
MDDDMSLDFLFHDQRSLKKSSNNLLTATVKPTVPDPPSLTQEVSLSQAFKSTADVPLSQIVKPSQQPASSGRRRPLFKAPFKQALARDKDPFFRSGHNGQERNVENSRRFSKEYDDVTIEVSQQATQHWQKSPRSQKLNECPDENTYTNTEDYNVYENSADFGTTSNEPYHGTLETSLHRDRPHLHTYHQTAETSFNDERHSQEDMFGTQTPLRRGTRDCNDTPRSLHIQGITPGGSRTDISKLRPVAELPGRYRNIFNFPYFNIVQSKVLDDVLYTDTPTVVCAPTGSGKTVLFELAIIRLLMQMGGHVTSNFKVVYMAPMKALCSERMEDWRMKFGPLGLECKELTGDTELDDYFELQQVNIVMTTPEKWDSMTRKWRDNKSLVQMVKLFMVDEVHLLNDSSRGATMEAVVSRMKTVQASMVRETNSDSPSLRVIAVSATLTNIEDIAEWLGSKDEPACFHKMDDSHRPVKLRKVTLGFPCAKNASEFRFDLSLNYKIAGVISTYSENKPTLVFCATRKSVQQGAATLVKDAKFIMNIEHKQKLQLTANSLRDSKLRDTVLYGVGFHHAGLDMHDRKAMEELFLSGDLPVLFATSTLAMGVNLPAHLVIIKSTQHYVMGVYQEYSETQVLQMIGRAGRPQFDDTATAVIMTRMETKQKYESFLNGAQLIESSLHEHLIEHLNAEIVLNTITDISVALEWIRSTFLYIRIMKNPKHYGLPEGLNKEQVEKRLQELCLKNLDNLEKVELVKMDEDHFVTKSTETGRLMARYCIAYDTMKQFTNLTGKEAINELLVLLSSCKEFRDVQLRVNERRVLNTLNKDKHRITIRFPMDGKIKTNEMKVNCLIQAQFGCLSIQDFALTQDINKIFRAAQRVIKCKLNSFASDSTVTLLRSASEFGE